MILIFVLYGLIFIRLIARGFVVADNFYDLNGGGTLQPSLKYNWTGVPRWVNWIATDESGFAWGHEFEPIQGHLHRGFWYLGGEVEFIFWPRENPFKGEWRESLEQRPEAEHHD